MKLERPVPLESWIDLTTANQWRQERYYEIAGVLGGAWLTVGDGSYGLDAQRLLAHGALSALPTDINPAKLQLAKERGHIPEYRVEDAQRLSFPDRAFDYVLCKESLHHIPRPAIALYEMLRVARLGLILVEPNDRKASLARRAVRALKWLSGRPLGHMDAKAYEEEGNYIYSIAPREIEKIALAANIPQVAFKWANDAYVPGLEHVPLESPAGRRMRRKIAFRDWLCCVGLDLPMLLAAAIFHQPLDPVQRDDMARAGWRVIDLPRNPTPTI